MERPPNALRKTVEGKTKIIWSEETVLVENKDDITAGDGVRRHVIEGKGALATSTTANCFRLLEAHGLKTHFIEQCGATVFRARRCSMIPVEVVTRRIATGSYLKRNPEIAEGTRFDSLVTELFLKDDARHDPLLFFHSGLEEWFVFDAKKPMTEPPLDRFFPERFRFAGRNVDDGIALQMQHCAKQAFMHLERTWAARNVTLVDMKIELGFDAATGELLIADEINNDCWRIWPDGDKAKMRDKQIYRNLASVTPEDLLALRDHYAWVAEATATFLDEPAKQEASPSNATATVLVRLKSEVLDPQGTAVQRALEKMGFTGIKTVRIGKLIEIEIDAAANGPTDDLRQRLAKMADELLANPVIEDYEVRL